MKSADFPLKCKDQIIQLHHCWKFNLVNGPFSLLWNNFGMKILLLVSFTLAKAEKLEYFQLYTS